MPYTKGIYGAADQSGNRIAYIVYMEFITTITRSVFWLGITTAAVVVGPFSALNAAFIVAALASLLTTSEKFKALSP